MSDTNRTAFKPTRTSTRQSLSSSTSTKENNQQESISLVAALPLASAGMMRKGRSQSLGGAELLKRGRDDEELSPGKKSRRGLVPRRSILKVRASLSVGDHANTTQFDTISSLNNNNNPRSQPHHHTTDFSSLSTGTSFHNQQNAAASSESEEEDEEEDEDDSGEQDMDITRMEEMREGREGADDRRKSMARRVSFAPNAHIRTFTPDKPTAQAQQSAAAAAQRHQDHSSSPSAPPSHLRHSSTNHPVSPQESSFEDLSNVTADSVEEDGNDEMSMEMANDEVTRAFAGHFGGTVPASVYTEEVDEDLNGPGMESESEEEDEDDDDDGTRAMEVVQEGENEITRFFAGEQTALVNAKVTVGGAAPLASAMRNARRPSEMMREEDREDEEVMRQLQLSKGGKGTAIKSRASVCFGGEGDSIDDDDEAETEDEADRTEAMEMTMAVGQGILISHPAPPSTHHSKANVQVGFAGILESDEENDTIELAKLVVAPVVYNLGISTPSTPTARYQAELFARQQAQLGTSSTGPIQPPNSPRRVNTPIRSASPRKPSTSAAHATLMNGGTPIRSPSKKLMATTPMSTLRLKQQIATLQTRSPAVFASASLSLKEMQESSRFATVDAASPARFASPSSLAISHAQVVSSPAAIRGWNHSPIVARGSTMGGKGKKVEENWMTNEGAEDENGSKETYSLDDFFTSTDMGFFDNVLATRTNGSSKKGMKKSVGGAGAKGTSPPDLADQLILASSHQYFFDMYQGESDAISKGMAETKDIISDMERNVLKEQPKLFSEWASSTGARREMLQSQFRMIKTQSRLAAATEYNTMRGMNYDRIVEALEADLEGLRADVEIVESTHFDQVIPHLELRKAEIYAELLKERERDYELAACDQEQLMELRGAMEEQGAELERIRSELIEVTGTLEGLTMKADELAEAENKLTVEVDGLRKRTEEGRLFTTENFFRMNAEFTALQHLHSCTLTAWTATSVTLLHADELVISLTLSPKTGTVTKVELELLTSRWDMNLDKEMIEVSWFLFEKIKIFAGTSVKRGGMTAKSLLHTLSSLWLSSRRLRTELSQTLLRYPLSISYSPSSLLVDIEVHLARAKTTFVVRIEIGQEDLFSDAMVGGRGRGVEEVDRVLGKVGSEVRIGFGNVDCEELKYIIRDILDTQSRGALLSACISAEEAAVTKA